jgi:DNA-binding NarL/FixJ family response regulator
MPVLFAAPGATVLLVAPPTLQRQGLIATLRDARPDLPIATTSDTHTLPKRLRRTPPALVILDATLRGVALDDLINQIRAVCPHQRMLILGSKKLPFAIARVIVEMGGGVLLTKHATPSDLLAAVARLVGEAAPNTPPADAAEPSGTYDRQPAADTAPVDFTPRELEILRLIVADHSSQEIAAQLYISVRTVETHRRSLLVKAGTRSMIGLILQAIRSGWVQVA